jgi:hypothetical protein
MYVCLGTHTGQAISELLQKVLHEWNIPSNRIHAVVSDNGANVKCGLRIAELPGIPCTIHTLQLVVHSGLTAQRSLKDAVTRARRMVGHFRHSSTANERLAVSSCYFYVRHLLHAQKYHKYLEQL